MNGTTDTSTSAAFQRVEALASLLDDGYKLPIIKLKVPIDPVVGLVPVLGDITTMILSGSIIVEAKKLNCPNAVLVQMVANMAADLVFGTIPIVGDVFDFFFRANKRNIKLLKQHIAEPSTE